MSVRRVVAEAQASDLDPRNCEVLLGLAARGPATVTEIADLLELSRSTVSHSLRLLDRGGLTQKTPALDGQLDDITAVEIVRIFCEACACGGLNALIHG